MLLAGLVAASSEASRCRGVSPCLHSTLLTLEPKGNVCSTQVPANRSGLFYCLHVLQAVYKKCKRLGASLHSLGREK